MEYIRAEGTAFREGAADFRVIGANCYYLGFGSDGMVGQVFDLASALRVNTLRTWAFWNGDPEWAKLDRTVAWAADRGVRVILTLVNYWKDFGGMPEWSRRFGLEGPDPFYTDGAVRAAFRAHVEGLLARENTITGRKYRDEPAIFAWELANEPRCEGKDCGIVFDWAAEMSAAIRNAGAQQMVSLGDEGYFRRARARGHQLYNGSHGMDHERLLGIPTIDFGTCHLYPNFDESVGPVDFGRRWIREHIEAANRASKPALIEEYGIVASADTRNEVVREWLEQVEESEGAGSMLWMIAGNQDDGTPYYDDGYTVYRAEDLPALIAHVERYFPGTSLEAGGTQTG